MNYYCVWFVIFATIGNLVNGNDIDDKSILKKLYKCSAEKDMNASINCVALQILKLMEKANSADNFQILPGVTIVNENNSTTRTPKKLEELNLPLEGTKGTYKLMSMVVDSLSRFFSGKSIKFQVTPSTKENLARALEEGRGKMKKMMGPLMLGLGATMVTMLPIMMGGLTMLASKAMLVGKMALVVSLIIFIQYFFNSRQFPSVTPYYPPTTNWLGGQGPVYGTPVYGAPNYFGSTSYGGGGGTNTLGRNYRSLQVEHDETEATTSQNIAYSSYNLR